MISTIFVGLLTTFGESLGMTTEQAFLSSVLIFPSVISTSGDLIKALAQRVLCPSRETSDQQDVASDRCPCEHFFTRK